MQPFWAHLASKLAKVLKSLKRNTLKKVSWGCPKTRRYTCTKLKTVQKIQNFHRLKWGKCEFVPLLLQFNKFFCLYLLRVNFYAAFSTGLKLAQNVDFFNIITEFFPKAFFRYFRQFLQSLKLNTSSMAQKIEECLS